MRHRRTAFARDQRDPRGGLSSRDTSRRRRGRIEPRGGTRSPGQCLADLAKGTAMPANPFHLAWFLQGSSIQAWRAPWTGNISEDWMSAELFLDLARAIERAGMD